MSENLCKIMYAFLGSWLLIGMLFGFLWDDGLAAWAAGAVIAFVGFVVSMVLVLVYVGWNTKQDMEDERDDWWL